jgi:hypothetical protein
VPNGLLASIAESAQAHQEGHVIVKQPGTYLPPAVPDPGQNLFGATGHGQNGFGDAGHGQNGFGADHSQNLFNVGAHAAHQLSGFGDANQVGQVTSYTAQNFGLTAPSGPSISIGNFAEPILTNYGVPQDIQNFGPSGRFAEPPGSHQFQFGQQNNGGAGFGNEVPSNHAPSHKDIPIRGEHGTYTLQVQASGGTSNNPDIPHEQILSQDLLKDVLAAIEQNPSGGQIGGGYGHNVEVSPIHDINSLGDLRVAGSEHDLNVAATDQREIIAKVTHDLHSSTEATSTVKSTSESSTITSVVTSSS